MSVVEISFAAPESSSWRTPRSAVNRNRLEHSQTSPIVIPWGLFEVERWALVTEGVNQT